MPVIEWSKHDYGVCESFIEVPAGATIDTVDGKEPVGRCDRCGMLILHGESFTVFEAEGELRCRKCR